MFFKDQLITLTFPDMSDIEIDHENLPEKGESE
jgi:hypothetical protein